MNAHRIETRLQDNGTLVLRDLPFAAGAPVEVIVLETNGTTSANSASTPSFNDDENWVESYIAECDRTWQEHASDATPPNLSTTWKQERRTRIMSQNNDFFLELQS